MEETYNGKILISNSSIVMDYFNQTVILMVEHDNQGAFGLVLNKNKRCPSETLSKESRIVSVVLFRFIPAALWTLRLYP